MKEKTFPLQYKFTIKAKHSNDCLCKVNLGKHLCKMYV
jgi:hypothetical protein